MVGGQCRLGRGLAAAALGRSVAAGTWRRRRRTTRKPEITSTAKAAETVIVSEGVHFMDPPLVQAGRPDLVMVWVVRGARNERCRAFTPLSYHVLYRSVQIVGSLRLPGCCLAFRVREQKRRPAKRGAGTPSLRAKQSHEIAGPGNIVLLRC